MINEFMLPNESFPMLKITDDTSISEMFPTSAESRLQVLIDHISSWTLENHFQLNPIKCKEIVTCFKRSSPSFNPVGLDAKPLERVSSAKVLGVIIKNDLKWNDHVDTITNKAAKRLYLLRQLKHVDVNTGDLVCLCSSVIKSVLEYACKLFHSYFPKYLSEDMERIQRRAMNIIYPGLNYKAALEETAFGELYARRETNSLKLFNEIFKFKDHKLGDLLPPLNSSYSSQLWRSKTFNDSNYRTDCYRKSFIIHYSNSCYMQKLYIKSKFCNLTTYAIQSLTARYGIFNKRFYYYYYFQSFTALAIVLL